MTDTHQKKLFIKSFGCQMNVYDSNRMADILKPLGYDMAQEPDDADMVILNTCHIREKATEKVFSDIGRLKEHKDRRAEEGKNTIIAVAGCVAQAEGQEIVNRAPAVDLVFGPQTYHELPEMILELDGGKKKRRVVNTDFPVNSKFDFLPEETGNAASGGISTFLSIQEGCDKFCTYCVVPYTRGAEFSRPVEQVLAEARTMAANGSREINLLGQNVNAYHGDGPDGKIWGLGRLIRAVAEIDGIDRIQYTTSHPSDVDDELIEAHRDVKEIIPYLHLPVQAGSDRILKAMNRKHTADDYRRVVGRLRDAQPGLAISGDFIVGFPGESDKDFEDTMQLVRDIGYSQAYSFKYSARPGTPAAVMQNLVHEKIKQERLVALQELLFQQQLDFNKSKIGETLPVLFERTGNKDGQIIGRSPYMQSVYVQGNQRLIGSIIDVKITDGFAKSLTGDIVTSERICAWHTTTLMGHPALTLW